jgi:hypothetical protein
MNKETLLKREVQNRNYFIFMVIAGLLASVCFTNGFGRNVDENGFCLQKISKYWPEYDFVRAEFQITCNHPSSFGCASDTYTYLCTGHITNNVVTRDGLREYNNESTVSFELINEADKDYLDSDDTPNFLLILGSILFFIFVISVMSFVFEIDDRRKKDKRKVNKK